MSLLNKIYRRFHRKQIFVDDVLKYLPGVEAPIILEAGAADGSDTLRFAKLLLPQGVIYAFEPVLQNFERLRELVGGRHNLYFQNGIR